MSRFKSEKSLIEAINDLKSERTTNKEEREKKEHMDKNKFVNFHRGLRFKFAGYNLEIQKSIQTTKRIRRTPASFFNSDYSSQYGSSSQDFLNQDDSNKKVPSRALVT